MILDFFNRDLLTIIRPVSFCDGKLADFIRGDLPLLRPAKKIVIKSYTCMCILLLIGTYVLYLFSSVNKVLSKEFL